MKITIKNSYKHLKTLAISSTLLAAANSLAIEITVESQLIQRGKDSVSLPIYVNTQGKALDSLNVLFTVDNGAIPSWSSLVSTFTNAYPGNENWQTIIQNNGSAGAFHLDFDSNDSETFSSSEAVRIGTLNLDVSQLENNGLPVTIQALSSLSDPAFTAGYTEAGLFVAADMLLSQAIPTEQKMQFTGSGHANALDANNWDLAQTPDITKLLSFNNNANAYVLDADLEVSKISIGYPNASGKLSTQGADIRIANDLMIASNEGDFYGETINAQGYMSVKDSDLFEVGHIYRSDEIPDGYDCCPDIYIAIVEVAPGENITATAKGELIVDNVKEVLWGEDAEFSQIEKAYIQNPVIDAFTNAHITTEAKLSLTNIERFYVGEDLELSKPNSDFENTDAQSVFSSSSELNVQNISTEFVVYEDFELSRGNICKRETFNGQAILDSRATLQDIEKFFVGEDLEIALLSCSQNNAQIKLSADILFNKIKDFEVFEDLEISTSNGAGNGNNSARSIVSFSNIENFKITERNLEIAYTTYYGEGLNGNNSVDAEVTFDNVEKMSINGYLYIANLFGQSDQMTTLNARAVVTFEGSDISVINSTAFGSAGHSFSCSAPCENTSVAQHNIDSQITLINSSLNSPLLQNGVITDGYNADVSAKLILSDSRINSEEMNAGSGSHIYFVINSIENAPAIDTSLMTLKGQVTARLNFEMSAGTQTFDLITTNSAGALEDADGTLLTEGLENGVTLNSFAIIQHPDSGVDILRLSISCTPADASKDNCSKPEEIISSSKPEEKSSSSGSFPLPIMAALLSFLTIRLRRKPSH